jgi:hypothetical protein
MSELSASAQPRKPLAEPSGFPPKASTSLGWWTARLGLVSASLGSVLGAAPDAQAAVITVTGRPVSITWPTGSEAFWDVDGDNSNDFRLSNPIFNGTVTYLFFTSLNGQGLVGDGNYSTVKALSPGFTVQQNLASFSWKDRSARSVIGGNGAFDGGFGFNGPNNGFVEGDNFFGFRFGDADPSLA